jgi:hypothetical protein
VDRSFCAWTVFFGLGLAGIFGAGAWIAWGVRLSGTADPVEVRLADVTPNGAAGNVHVRIRDMQFGIDYIPSVNDKTGRWRSVLVPLLSGGRVRAMLRSEHVADGWQLQALERQPVITGIVGPPPPYFLKPEDAARLSARYPGVDFSALPAIDEGREFPTARSAWTLTAVSALGWFWAGLAGRLWWTAGRPKWVRAEETTPAARLRAAGFAPVEGLGGLQETFTIGSKRDMIFTVATFPVLLGGCLAGTLFGSQEFDRWLTIFLGLVELAFLVVFYVAVTSPGHVEALYDHGLVSHSGRKMTTCRWDEVESATGLLRCEVTIEGVKFYVPGPIRLCRAGGEAVTVAAVDDEMKLVNAVRYEVVRRQLPRALEALRKGKKVSVGPLELDRNGIAGPGEWWVAWGQLGDVWCADKLVIQENGLKNPLWSGSLGTPNAALLVELAEAAKRGEIG